MNDTMIHDLPEDERPRERMARHGSHTLSDAELIAILLGSGVRGKSALTVARELLANGIFGLARSSHEGGRKTAGIGPAKSSRIEAALELGRRLASESEAARDSDPIRDPESIARPLINRYGHYVQERLGCIFLDSKNRILREQEIYVGTLNATTVSTRDILRRALDEHAASIILFHNHPSGDPAPSADDLLFTRKMVDAGKLMGIDILDHLILGRNRFVSLKQRGAM